MKIPKQENNEPNHFQESERELNFDFLKNEPLNLIYEFSDEDNKINSNFDSNSNSDYENEKAHEDQKIILILNQKLDKIFSGLIYQKNLFESNLNLHITKKLEKMEEICLEIGDKWRAFSYRKAVSNLKGLSYEIKTEQDALNLKGIGKSIAKKIQEIITNKISKLESLQGQTFFTYLWCWFFYL